MPAIELLMRKIKAFVFDVDGVFTNGSVLLSPSGELLRTMNIKDGYAVQYAVKRGFPIAIISGGKSDAVRLRFEHLGVTDIYMNSGTKTEAFEHFLSKYQLTRDEILYMGDDLPDLQIMKTVAIAACPSDAATEIKETSSFVSSKAGGEGCVRDVIERVLREQGSWLGADAFTW